MASRDEQHFELWAGNYKRLRIIVSDIPHDLATAEIVWGMSRDPKGDPLITKDNNGAGGITVESYNEIVIIIDPADTEDLIRGRYYHECGILDGDDRPFTVAAGRVDLKQTLWSKIYNYFNP